MRPGFDFFVLLLVTAVLGGLAELIHTAVLADLDRLAPAFVPFLQGGLVALVLAPLFAAISRQLATTRAALACAARGERLARSRIALIGEALRAGQFTIYEVDVERDRLRVLGGGGVIGREDGDAPFAIEDWLARCHPEDEAVVRAGYVALVDGTAASFERSYRRRADDGTWRWLRVYAHVSLADAAGRARRIVGAVCDVTRQRDAGPFQHGLQTLRTGRQNHRRRLARCRLGLGSAHHRVDDPGKPELQHRRHGQQTQPAMQAYPVGEAARVAGHAQFSP